jgi:parallel beta-helix repeat protein
MSTKNRVGAVFKKMLPIFIMISILALLSTLFLVPRWSLVSADPSDHYRGVIRITSNGTVEGTDKILRNGNVYTLIDDISGDVEVDRVFISIECDGVIFDGAGKTIRGTDNGRAIIINAYDVVIKNTCIINFGTGIEMVIYQASSSMQIVDNYFETRWHCLTFGSGCTSGFASGNTFIARNGNGVQFMSNTGTTFIDNKFINCSYTTYNAVLKAFSGNTLNGKPLVVLEGQSNQIIDGAAQVRLINCKDMVIRNVDASGSNYPIELVGVSNSLITNCKAPITLENSNNNTLIDNKFSQTGGTWQSAAVALRFSHNNTVTQNSIAGSNCCGIILSGSRDNCIANNDISSSGIDNRCAGISLSGCEYNYFFENNIASEDYGFYLQSVEHNEFSTNNIYKGRYSIFMQSAMHNTFSGNTFMDASEYAISLLMSDYNNFYWNSFVGNTKVTETNTDIFWLMNATYYAEYNKWDNGEEGNYWSDYKGQSTNGNNIGKIPYTVYGNFTDNYPLIQPFNRPSSYKSFPTIPIAIGVIVIVGIALLTYFKKTHKQKLV